MLLLKRLFTTVVLAVVLFGVVFVGTMSVGGAMAGARLAAQNPNQASGFDRGYALGVRAGVEFRRQYAPTVARIAGGVALVGAVGLSFAGVFPWCRRRPLPPPLPPAFVEK